MNDEFSGYAIFSDLGSTPASMEWSNGLDADGLLPGNATQQSDGVRAYTQANLRAKETIIGPGGRPIDRDIVTWVRLPPGLRP